MNADVVWDALVPDAAGLVAAVIVHADDGRVLMLGYMNRAALTATLERGQVTFFSRSRQRLWVKGETSGNVLEFVDLRIDCDADALLIRAHPHGPTCHTGTASCFFRTPGQPDDNGPRAAAILGVLRVESVIHDRIAQPMTSTSSQPSYVRALVESGPAQIQIKIREEADELCRALDGESRERVISEAADLVFHMVVGLATRSVALDHVAAELDRRSGVSGLEEKANRIKSL